MKSINDIDCEHKKVLIRVDFNVPIGEDGKVTDTTRIEAAKPTIIKALEDGGSVILMTHLGRPKGMDLDLSLQKIVPAVSEVLGVEVKFVADTIGEQAQEAAANLQNGEILLLENLRFHAEETAGDEEFAQQLAKLAPVYVNDAFGTAHRAHASTAIIAKFAQQSVAGLLLESEVKMINKVLQDADKPITAIIGGAKVSSKISVIENLLSTVDHLIIGGGMAFTFIKARGGEIGSSLVEEDKLELARKVEEKAKQHGVHLHLPTDSVTADSFSEHAATSSELIDQIPAGWMGLDIGAHSIEKFSNVIQESKTILWNGPMGVFEMEPFAAGTKAIADAVVTATQNGAFSLVGGGDSVAAVNQMGVQDQVSYVSTGGGAMLEMLEGKQLPGVVALE